MRLAYVLNDDPSLVLSESTLSRRHADESAYVVFSRLILAALPTADLAGHASNVIKLGVAVEQGQASVLSRRRDEQVRTLVATIPVQVA